MLAVLRPKARIFVVAAPELLGDSVAAARQLLPLHVRESTTPLARDFV